jgi:hypothetical protein
MIILDIDVPSDLMTPTIAQVKAIKAKLPIKAVWGSCLVRSETGNGHVTRNLNRRTAKPANIRHPISVSDSLLNTIVKKRA